MGLRARLRRLIEVTGYTVHKIAPSIPDATDINSCAEDEACSSAVDAPDPYPTYNQDGLKSIHNHDFMDDPSFRRAYDRGCQAASDYNWHWRVHIGLWAGFTASKIPGDFVECGVNRGFLSSAIMEFLNWNSQNRVFYLLDTFEGLDLRYVSDDDLKHGALEKNEVAKNSGFYVSGADSVQDNFSEWDNVKIIQGSIPDTLEQVESREIAYVHLDMNCSPPEVAALEFFWDRMSPGAIILLDDYAYRTYEAQKYAMDEFARQKNVMIASLPTGQGLLQKPPEVVT
ncbi:MAG: hypothetical protein ACI9G5_000740 [Paracoccaceae bacterium]|jgi:hypothetical protein